MNAHDIALAIDTLDYEIADAIDAALNVDMGMTGRTMYDHDFDNAEAAARTLDVAVRNIALRLHVDADALVAAIDAHVAKERSALLLSMIA